MEVGVKVKVLQTEIIDLTVPGSLTFLLLVMQRKTTLLFFNQYVWAFLKIKIVMTAELCIE